MEEITDTRFWGGATPELSVLIPFYGDDPVALLSTLEAQAEGLAGAMEIVVLNDGNPDQDLTRQVQVAVAGLRCAARLIRLPQNEGRAKGRNRLVRHARGGHFLFLDSDMAPDAEDFLKRWLETARDGAAVVFGGFTVDRAPRSRETDLHRSLSQGSDCRSADERAREPEKHVFTSNLLVRRDVFEAEGFDEHFQGWGWEDVEWAMRVSRRWPITHIDNTATHLGLDPVETLARKYEQSAANFQRVRRAHPDIVSRYPSFRAARALKRAPWRREWRPALRALAGAPAPMRLRVIALKLYRASLYAEVI